MQNLEYWTSEIMSVSIYFYLSMLLMKFQINLGRTRDMSSISNMPIIHEGIAMADNQEYVWDKVSRLYRASFQL